jgi:3-oxoacyl-(acyl-carrier-protein) synthase
MKSMRRAIEDAHLAPCEIDCLYAGTSAIRRTNAEEARAIRDVFTDYAIPVSSVKAALGEAHSASMAFGLCASLLSIESGSIPPIAGFLDCDEECLLDVVAPQARLAHIRHSIVNAIAPGGAAASIVVGRSRWEPRIENEPVNG